MQGDNYQILDNYTDSSELVRKNNAWADLWQNRLINALTIAFLLELVLVSVLSFGMGLSVMEVAGFYAASLAMFLMALIAASFLGAIVSFLPLKKLSYSVKFPLFTLSIILLINLAYVLLTIIGVIGV